jgi:hypothetical protein
MSPRTITLIIIGVIVYLVTVASAGLIIASTVLGRATLYAVGGGALWVVAVVFSRRRWPRIGCKSCGGEGKRYEPLLFRLICFRWRRRAWRPCDECSGAAWQLRPQGLSLRAP